MSTLVPHSFNVNSDELILSYDSQRFYQTDFIVNHNQAESRNLPFRGLVDI